MPQASGLRIVRGAHIIWDRNVAFEVLVDDEAVGAVRASGEINCSVKPGRHRVQVRSDADDARSNEVEIHVVAGEMAELACSTRPGFGFFNPLLVGRLFRPKIRPIDHHGAE